MIFPGAPLSSSSSSLKKEERLRSSGDQSPDLRDSPPPPPYPVEFIMGHPPHHHRPAGEHHGPLHAHHGMHGGHGRRGQRCLNGEQRCQRKCRDRRRHLFRRMLSRFVVFVSLSMLYVHSDRVQQAWASIVNHTPAFLLTVFSVIGHLLAWPLAVSQTMGIVFYSALAAFLLTVMHVKIRRRRMMRWRARWTEASRTRHGRSHDHEAWPASHHHHAHPQHHSERQGHWHEHQTGAHNGYQQLPQEEIMVPHSPQSESQNHSDFTYMSEDDTQSLEK